MAAIYDVSTGRATVGDVVTDIGAFSEGWITALIAGPTYDAELEKTHAYALFLLLIPGCWSSGSTSCHSSSAAASSGWNRTAR
jgi:hypothetical protein